MRRLGFWLMVLVIISGCVAPSAATVKRQGDGVTPEHTATSAPEGAGPLPEETAAWRSFNPVIGEDAHSETGGCKRGDGENATSCSFQPGGSDAAEPSDGGETASVEGLRSDFVIDVYQGEETLGGSEPQLSEVLARGKPVVVVFWAGQCPVCRREMPEIEEVSAHFEDQVIFLGVDVGPYTGLGTKDDARALIADLGLTFPIGSTPEPAVLRKYHVTGVPTLLFFTPTGERMDGFTGAMDANKLRRAVEDLLAASQ